MKTSLEKENEKLRKFFTYLKEELRIAIEEKETALQNFADGIESFCKEMIKKEKKCMEKDEYQEQILEHTNMIEAFEMVIAYIHKREKQEGLK